MVDYDSSNASFSDLDLVSPAILMTILKYTVIFNTVIQDRTLIVCYTSGEIGHLSPCTSLVCSETFQRSGHEWLLLPSRHLTCQNGKVQSASHSHTMQSRIHANSQSGVLIDPDAWQSCTSGEVQLCLIPSSWHETEVLLMVCAPAFESLPWDWQVRERLKHLQS